MMSRPVVAAAILIAWIGGLGMLLRQELFRSPIERLAQAALRVTPRAIFYTVMQGDQHVGFASSTVDTTTTTIEQRDYLVTNVVSAGQVLRSEMRTTVILSRTLRMRRFEITTDAGDVSLRMGGEMLGDTMLQVAVQRGAAAPDTQRVPIAGPLLLATLAPMAMALDDRPRVGRSYALPVFDPGSLSPTQARYDIRAESLFVVNDSSVFDSTSGRWQGVLPDTIRAWQIVPQAGSDVRGWVDEQGRLVATTQLGFQLLRQPYEVAFENWRRQGDPGAASTAARTPFPIDPDVVAATAIASGRRVSGTTAELRVRLGGIALDGSSLAGGRQRLAGDTLIVTRENSSLLAPRYLTILGGARAGHVDLRAEEFLEVDHPEIVALAQRFADESRNPRVVAQRIVEWMRDSIHKEPASGIPSALHVLHTRRGDAAEHTQLFVALARAAGVPARSVAGLLHSGGKFYYHAWPEVLLRGWVAVDPTFGQFPADAAHVRLVTGSAGRQADLLRAIGGLTLDVVGTR
ncbi:MAG: transglutaminase-like domain-containing protein [Gemmatimonadaceae bacterium]